MFFNLTRQVFPIVQHFNSQTAFNGINMPAQMRSFPQARSLCSLCIALTAAVAWSAPRQKAVFADTGPSPADAFLTWTVALEVGKSELIKSELIARSTPGNAKYGKWLHANDVRALVDPGPTVRAAARAHLPGATCVDLPSGLRCSAHARAVNAIFGTTLHAFTHTHANGKQLPMVHRAPKSEPFVLPKHVAFVSGLQELPTRRRRLGSSVSFDRNGRMSLVSRRRRLSANDYFVTPGETQRSFTENFRFIRCQHTISTHERMSDLSTA